MAKHAPWLSIKTPGFQKQAKRLRPEHSKAGGIKWRSAPQQVIAAVYRAIKELFLLKEPVCQACKFVRGAKATPLWADDVHHTRGKLGLLLFDVRFFKAVCRPCHNWIGDNIDLARKYGLLCEKGDWNKLLAK